MQLILLAGTCICVLVASIKKPLVGLIAMVLATQMEYFFNNLPAGLSLGRVAGVLAVIGWISNEQHNKNILNLVKNPVFIPIYAFICVTLAGALIAINPSVALFRVFRLSILLLMAILTIDLIRTRNDMIALLTSIVIAAGIGSFMTIVQQHQYSAGTEIVGNVYDARLGVRFSGLQSDPNSLGIQVLTAMPFALVLLFGLRKAPLRLLALFVLGAGAMTLIFSVSRSNVFPFVGLLGISYVIRRIKSKPAAIESFAIVALIVIIAFAYGMAGTYAQDRILRPITHIEEDSSFGARMRIMTEGFSVMLENPVFGVGFMNSVNYFEPKDAHDTISVLVGETGLLGTILFVIFCFHIATRQATLLKRVHLVHDPLLDELALSLIGVAFVLLIWIPVKILLVQRLFWFWVGFVLWMDYRLPHLATPPAYKIGSQSNKTISSSKP